MTGYVVGLDLGSSSLKVVVTDARLAVVGRGRVGYGVDHPRPGWAEQPVARWEAALAPAIRQALASAGVAATDVVALGLAGQLDGCVAVDADGRALAPCLIWMDRRATAEVPDLPADTFQQRTGQVLDASHLAAKARWLAARHPVARLHQPVSYLVSILTGAHVMDAGLASTTNLYDLRAGAWAGDLCAAFALDPAWLPTLAPAASRAGWPTTTIRTGARRGFTTRAENENAARSWRRTRRPGGGGMGSCCLSASRSARTAGWPRRCRSGVGGRSWCPCRRPSPSSAPASRAGGRWRT